MISLQQIKTALSKAIQQSELSQTEIANKLNIGQPNISHYIKGDKMPALDTFANLCEVLDLDANEILCISKH